MLWVTVLSIAEPVLLFIALPLSKMGDMCKLQVLL